MKAPKWLSNRRRAVWIGLAAISLTGVAAWLIEVIRPDPDHTAARFSTLLEHQDWGAIYDMASNYEKQREPWSREQFVTLMNELGRTCFTRIANVRIEGDWAHQTTSKMFRIQFEAWRPSGAHETCEFIETLRRDHSTWYPTIYYVPIYLHNLVKKSTRESLSRLVAAAKRARIVSIVRFDTDMELSIPRLEDYLAGRAAWEDIYIPHPNSATLRQLGG